MVRLTPLASTIAATWAAVAFATWMLMTSAAVPGSTRLTSRWLASRRVITRMAISLAWDAGTDEGTSDKRYESTTTGGEAGPRTSPETRAMARTRQAASTMPAAARSQDRRGRMSV